MLISLRLQPAAPEPPPDALRLLIDCHERIRAFSALALRLTRAPEPLPSELSEAAGRVERYFTVGLPLHVADEDATLAPLLREAGAEPILLEALAEMTRQHRELDARLDALTPRWRRLRDEPERLHELAPQLSLDTEAFTRGMEAHLALEEREIFPRSRERLSLGSLDALAEGIRERRGAAARR